MTFKNCKIILYVLFTSTLFFSCGENELETLATETSEEYEILNKSYIHLNKTYNVSFKRYKEREDDNDLVPIDGPDNEYVKKILDNPESGIIISTYDDKQFLHNNDDEYRQVMLQELGYTRSQLDKISKSDKDDLKSAVNGYVKFHKNKQNSGTCSYNYNSSTYRIHYLNTNYTNPSSANLYSMNDKISQLYIWWNDWFKSPDWDYTASCGESATIQLFEHSNFGGKKLTLSFNGNMPYGNSSCHEDVVPCNSWDLDDYNLSFWNSWDDDASSLKTIYFP